MGVSLILCGGGSRGCLSCGSLNYIYEKKIPFDIVYAGSVGALNALLFLQGQLDELNKLWLSIHNKDVYSFSPFNLLNIFSSKASIYSSKPLEKLIRKYLDIEKIKALPIPFMVGTTNLTTMTSEIKDLRTLDYEAAVQWLLASASPPILFPVISINTDDYCDTGILNNYFLSNAINDGYDTIICISPTRVGPKPINNLVDVIQATISTSSFGYLDRETKAIEKINKVIDFANLELENDLKKINLYVVRPPWIWNQGLIDFNYKVDRPNLILSGYQIAAEVLKDIIYPS